MQELYETVSRYAGRGTPFHSTGRVLPRRAAVQFVGSFVCQGRLNAFCAALVARFMASNEALVVVSRDAVQKVSCDGYSLQPGRTELGPTSGEITGVVASAGFVTVGYSAGVTRYSSRLQLQRELLFDGYANSILSIAVPPDGSCIATGGGNAVVTVWSSEMSNVMHYLSGHTDWVRFVKFTKDNDQRLQLFSTGDDGLILHWDPIAGLLLSRLDSSHGESVRAFEVSWQTGFMAIACDSPIISLYKPREGGVTASCRPEIHRLEHIGQITDAHGLVPTTVRFSGDSQWVISAGEDETLAVSSVTELKTIFVCSEFITRRHCMAFMNTFTSLCILASPPESSAIIIVACATDGTVVQWVVNPTTARSSYTKKLQLHLGALVAMDFVRDNAGS
ncbi:1-alkyl-2-acetylglycerophosphocholine esterase [Trypanosoma rangeli]|uniref:1-alkyl-2-acetylglycerophosphocholine esterase n=1 Tax=Trypanosoma rangeli TaxID=5698 RepID=A0A422MYE0_TRYRA|nr:1-alkyl-2-acetylglycerophosphocholine esterase [Trypanosoma rangeli]RNE98199.1 1-alkyl-2-acetylglycerophosphocholine esterase [Trypanosoma rangeli]|eukprot:RNE98199.1 1-alkyl-2-acetylglycerophosphocholine esterase [Trypanosoma rangeli]